jgi:hypothetical protein
MKWRCVVILLLLPLTACNGPHVRSNLALCKIAPTAKDRLGAWDTSYLKACMRAHGYVVDYSRTGQEGLKCENLPSPQVDARCYRQDSPLGG